MKRDVTAELEVEITAATTLEFQIAVAPVVSSGLVSGGCLTVFRSLFAQPTPLGGLAVVDVQR